MSHRTLFAVALSVCLAGCAGNPAAEIAARDTNKEFEKSGNPYRWRVENAPGAFNSVMQKELIGTPSTTAADAQVQADILKTIGDVEAKQGGSQTPALVETRTISQTSAEIVEVWVVSRADKQIAYTVSMKPSPKGGTDFSVKGPW